MALNTNVMAGLITLGVLLALGDFMEGLDAIQRLGFILAPTLAAGLCGEPLVAALREERRGVVASSAWSSTARCVDSVCHRCGVDLLRNDQPGRCQ